VVLAFIGVLVAPKIASAQLAFAETSSSSQFYMPYLPGMNQGEVGVCTVSPGNVSTMPNPFINSMGGGSGFVKAQSPAEYMPDVTVRSIQTLAFTWNLPPGFNPNQTLNLSANLNASTADGSSVFITITGTNLNSQPNGLFGGGWNNYNGQDIGGSWGGNASANIAQFPMGSITMEGEADSFPVPITGQLAQMQFGLTMSAMNAP
jgi:hypothetical protein